MPLVSNTSRYTPQKTSPLTLTQFNEMRFQAEAGEELEDWKAKGTEKLRGFLRNKELVKEGDAL